MSKACRDHRYTHVLVSDPTVGYGIFIENMLDAAG
ncbi:MAG: SpoIVB peptidase S55 domain-containing protein [Lachnospiraceae bacterium]